MMSTPQYQTYGGTTARTTSSPASRLDVFKKPLDPDLLAKVRKRKVKVLDEDEFVEKVEKIVERDFFPELEKLKAQNEYIDARERKDYITMSRLQEKYSGCRPNTGGRLASPATFETPQDYPRENDPRRPPSSLAGDLSGPSSESGAASSSGLEAGDEEKMNLDKFLANHTSEDNESFREIQEEAEKKHRMKNAWMYKDEAMFLNAKAEQMTLPSIEEQADPPPKPLQVDTWTFQNINSVFHNPDTLELSYEEKLEVAKKQKEIKHSNTRLAKVPWKTDKQMELLRREADKQRDIAAGKVGVDGKEIVRAQTPMVNGFKMMSMAPSPALGITDSPLMTWGEVESTPFRLEGCETPLLPASGPGFTIKDVPKRDRIGKELADRNSRYYRDRKQKALQQVKQSMKGGRLGSGGAVLAHMSPAAQRLVSGRLGIRLGTDDMLRASYTPSPHSNKFSTPTPRHLSKGTPSPSPSAKKTPKVSMTSIRTAKNTVDTRTTATKQSSSVSTSASPPSSSTVLAAAAAAAAYKRAMEERREKETMEQLNTDNLLNISNPKRKRAKEFFKPAD